MPRHDLYDDDGSTENQLCTQCGDSFLAEHDDRRHCGRCGYTEWK